MSNADRHENTVPHSAWAVHAILAFALLAMVITFHYYTRIEPRFEPKNFHAMQGEAFLAGHTYLKTEPSPQLLALKDPYDPAKNWPYVLWDASLYHGKYYLYFGPVPAAIWAIIKMGTGVSLTDPELALAFTCIATTCLIVLLALTALQERMAYGAGLACAFVALSFSTWLPFLLRRPSFYEVAISGAYCFSAIAMLALWGAVNSNRKPYAFAALASLSFGLAAGCRMTFALSVIPLCMVLLFMLRRLPWRRRLVTLILLCVPWACCIAALMAFNYERFGSVVESGVHYQLTLYNAQHPGFPFFAIKYSVPHLYLYLLRPLKFLHPFAFPFVYVNYFAGTILPFGIVAESKEPAFGLLTNGPFSLWVFAAPYCWLKRQKLSPNARVLTSAVGLQAVMMLSVMACFFFSTMRYAVDFAPWVMLFAAIQYLRVLSLAKTRAGFALLIAAGVLMVLYGTFTGTMSGYCGYLCNAP